MHKSYTYWDNRYKVGEINFIKTSAQNLQRKFFIDWLSKADHVKSILEVGPGEMLEYQSIRSKRPDIKYAISDVSMIFIENCKQKYPAVDTYRVSLEELDTINKEFDCIYICQVLEHSVNIRKAIKKCC
jgi:ubiquinone/menaquinone biosynthesis C-methylase UbiE